MEVTRHTVPAHKRHHAVVYGSLTKRETRPKKKKSQDPPLQFMLKPSNVLYLYLCREKKVGLAGGLCVATGWSSIPDDRGDEPGWRMTGRNTGRRFFLCLLGPVPGDVHLHSATCIMHVSVAHACRCRLFTGPKAGCCLKATTGRLPKTGRNSSREHIQAQGSTGGNISGAAQIIGRRRARIPAGRRKLLVLEGWHSIVWGAGARHLGETRLEWMNWTGLDGLLTRT